MFFYNEDAEINSDRLNVLYDLINNWEDEVVEFKEAENDYDKDKIGKYFSAISNEANLKGVQFGWLIFGVKNKTREIVGSNYRSTKGLAALKQEISSMESAIERFIRNVLECTSSKSERDFNVTSI